MNGLIHTCSTCVFGRECDEDEKCDEDKKQIVRAHPLGPRGCHILAHHPMPKHLDPVGCKPLKTSFRYPFTRLAFSGGSSNGLTFVGAYQALYEAGIMDNIHKIAGCSAGSITATLVSLKLTPIQLNNIVLPFDFNSLLDGGNTISEYLRLVFKYGLNKGRVLEQWVDDQLYNTTGKHKITFRELHDYTRVHLRLVVTNETDEEGEYWDYLNHPNCVVSKAVRISASLPWLFKAVKYNGKLWTDGGVSDFFPLNTFVKRGTDPRLDRQTLGLVLATKDNDVSQSIFNVYDQFLGLYSAFSNALFDAQHKHDNWRERSISVPSPGKAVTDFSFTMDEKLNAINVSRDVTNRNLAYFRKHGKFPLTDIVAPSSSSSSSN